MVDGPGCASGRRWRAGCGASGSAGTGDWECVSARPAGSGEMIFATARAGGRSQSLGRSFAHPSDTALWSASETAEMGHMQLSRPPFGYGVLEGEPPREPAPGFLSRPRSHPRRAGLMRSGDLDRTVFAMLRL